MARERTRAEQALDRQLSEAALDGNLVGVTNALTAGATHNRKGISGETTLHIAALLGHAEIVKALLAAGADKDAKTLDGTTPLHWALLGGHAEIVKALLAAGADKHAEDILGSTPLHWAAGGVRVEVVSALLVAGADKDAEDTLGRTLLHKAVLGGHAEIVDTLLAVGADKDAKNKDGDTPLHLAALRGHAGIVDTLLAAGADKDAEDTLGRTPLHFAALRGHAEIVDTLLAVGADKDAEDTLGRTPLHNAVFECHAGIVGALLEAGADVNTESLSDLLSAAKGEGTYGERYTEITPERTTIVKILNAARRESEIEDGANLKPEEMRDQTLVFLHGVATGNLHKCQDALMPGNPEELLATPEETRPINDVEAIRDHRFLVRRTALHLLAEHPELGEAAQGLADTLVNRDGLSKVDPNARDGRGRTALHTALEVRNVGLIEQLVLLGSDVNAQFQSDGEMLSPLEYALLIKDEQLANILIASEGPCAKLAGETIVNPLQFAIARMESTETALRHRTEVAPSTVTDLPEGTFEAAYFDSSAGAAAATYEGGVGVSESKGEPEVLGAAAEGAE